MKVSFYNLTHNSLYDRRADLPNGSIIVCTDVSRMYVKMNDKIFPMTPNWNKSKKIIPRKNCIHCGAPLPFDKVDGFVIKCEYCGTVYDIDDEKEI